MNVLEETQLLTVAEVARRLQQSERTVRDKIVSGALPAVKIGTAASHPAERRVPSLGESTSAAGRGIYELG
jgi:excisionase family DNA binding protein